MKKLSNMFGALAVAAISAPSMGAADSLLAGRNLDFLGSGILKAEKLNF